MRYNPSVNYIGMKVIFRTLPWWSGDVQKDNGRIGKIVKANEYEVGIWIEGSKNNEFTKSLGRITWTLMWERVESHIPIGGQLLFNFME